MTSIRERNRLGRALNDIDVRIHAKLGSDEILQSALDGFVEALNADAGDIKLVEGDEWVVRYENGFGADEVGLRLSISDAPVAEAVARGRQTIVIRDYLEQDAVPYVGFPLRHHLRSAIAVPLIVRGDVAGCLFAWMRSQPRAFTPGEVDFARRMAASVALALENARLFEAEQAARQRAEAAEERLRLELGRTKVLLKASDELTSSVDVDELLERLAHVLLDASGISRAFVNLIDMERQVLVPKVATGGLNAPRGVEIPLRELSQTAHGAILAKKTALLDYELPATPEHDREIALANNARLVLFVPLIHQDDVIGHVSLDEPGVRGDFSHEQIRVVESIAAQAAIALKNASMFEQEHRIAETLQQALLSPPAPIEAIDLALIYQPASAASRVGGDFYDVFEIGGSKIAMVVGDVSGKGIGAAQLTALIRDGVRAYLLEDDDPAECLTRLNALVHRFTPTEKFATVVLGVLDRGSGDLRYCSAGHPSAVVVRADGDLHALESQPGLVGAFPEAPFESRQDSLAPGDVLVMVTDGVTEARCGAEMLGDSGLFAALERLRDTPVPDLPKALLSDVIGFAGGRLRDDVVILCVSRTS